MTNGTSGEYLNVREALSRRVLLAMEQVFDWVATGKMTGTQAKITLNLLAETTLPFCDAASVQTISDVVASFSNAE